jgi:TolB-like protein/Tfp pilus assembly protein PilF
MEGVPQSVYRFAGFSLDARDGLLRNGAGEVELRPKSLELLIFLVRNAGRVISKDELLSSVWKGLVVTEDSLTQCIHDVRRALGDSEQKLIRTVPRRGYLFAAEALDNASVPGDQAKSPGAGRPAVAVLPFTNISGDPEQQYFSDGITEDIITELSRFRSLFVIARNSSFAFKSRAIDLREVGRQLGAPYIVEGSVRKSGQRIRISAQLIDAASGNHLWSERYDRDLADIFAIQDEVTAAIAGTVAGQVQIAGIESVRRRTGNLAAYDWYLKGLEHGDRAGAEDTLPAMSCFAKAIELDPSFARAHALLAFAQLIDALSRWYEPEHGSQLDEALRSAERAVALDGNDAIGYAALAEVYFLKKRFDLAAFHIGKARALNPNDPYVIGQQCVVEAYGANPERTLELIEHARRLSPIQPNWLCDLWGVALYQLRRYAEAADVFERATGKWPYIYSHLAACHAQLGDLAKAKAAAAEYLRRQPNFSLETWLAQEPYACEANLLHMADGLRKAGLPE